MAEIISKEKIVITVEADTDKAKKNTNDLEKALEGVGKAAKEAGDKIDKGLNGNGKDNVTAEALADSKETADKLSESAKKLSDALGKVFSAKQIKGAETIGAAFKKVFGGVGKVGKAFGKGTFGIAKMFGYEPIKNAVAGVGQLTQKYNKFLAAVGRIAVYRAIRAVLKQISQAVREGVNNLYLWAQATGNSFTSSMDSMATSFLYLKNSIGAAVSPILDVFAPAIDTAANAVVGLFNAVNQLISLLSGSSTWRRAIKVQTTYAEANNLSADSAHGAAKATKEYENTVLGFDELNKLNDVSDPRGGGSSSFKDYSGMFEEVPIDKTFMQSAFEMGKQLGENINKALDIDWAKIQGKAAKASEKLQQSLMGLIHGVDWKKLGNTFAQGFNTVLTFGNRFVQGMDWQKLGISLGTGLNSTVDNLDWDGLGLSFTNGLKMALETLHGFLREFNWNSLRKGLTDGVDGAFRNIDWGTAVKDLVRLAGEITSTVATFGGAIFKGISNAMGSVQWFEVGQMATKYLESVDWNGVISSLFEFIGSVAQALLYTLAGIFGELGAAVSEGFKNGILEGLKNIGNWIMENIVNPLVNGFKKGLGIHSPSTVMKSIGADTSAGFLEGMNAGWKSLSSWLSDKLSEIRNWANKLKGAVETAFNSTYSSGKSFSDSARSYSGGGVSFSTKKSSISAFAGGGFPNSGSLFLAGEAGAEFVGNVGGRTGVVNEAGLSGAVAQGNQSMVNALVIAAESIVGAINSKDTNAYLDSRLVSQALYQANAKTALAHGGSLIRR